MAYDNGEAPVRPGNSGRADYPRMLYHPDGRTQVAGSPEEHDILARDGWDTVPAAIHQKPTVSHFGALGATSDPMLAAIREIVRDEVRAVLREEFKLHNIGKRYTSYGT